MANETTVVLRERDEESGKFTEPYSLEMFVGTLRDVGPIGTQNVADVLGCSYELAYRRLHKLKQEGRVSSSRVGNARLWSAVEGDA